MSFNDTRNKLEMKGHLWSGLMAEFADRLIFTWSKWIDNINIFQSQGE